MRITILKNITISKILKILECCIWICCGTYTHSWLHAHSRVVFLDVGQGDSILIQQGDFEILIDGGSDDTVVYKMGEYMRWDDKMIDVVLITHMHDDHYMGIKYLMEVYNVGMFLLSPNCTDLCTDFRRFNHRDVSMGDSIKYGSVTLNILWPRVGVIDDNLNNDSIVILVRYLDKRILLMADAEVEVEDILIHSYETHITNIDILKAGHHCSKTASSYGFLNIVNPYLSICSCGEDNRFGHPHIQTLQNFDSLGLDYIITWEYGDYIVE